jgi:integrase
MFSSNAEKKLSGNTILHHFGLVSSILSTAVKWNMITDNPARRVDLRDLKKKKYKPAYYNDEQVFDMFAALEKEPLRYKAMVYLTIDLGIRESEVTGLRWNDIDLDSGAVNIDKQRQYVSTVGTFEKDPKTDAGVRVVTMSETVKTLMRQYRSRQMEDLLKLGVQWNDGLNVFLHEDGAPLHPQRPYKWFVEFLSRHDLPKITYHQLRHSNASLMVAAGVDVVTLAGRLGHSDKNTTLRVYSHLIESKEKQVANVMDQFYTKRIKNGQ